VICSQVGARVNVNDFIGREARGLADGQTFSTGKYRFRYCQTPHLPHGWDAGLLFEATEKTLFCSDLFHQLGDMEPLTSDDVVGRSRKAMKEFQTSILAEYVPYTPLTAQNLKKLADLKPKTLAVMHGSSFTGDGARARRSQCHVARNLRPREVALFLEESPQNKTEGRYAPAGSLYSPMVISVIGWTTRSPFARHQRKSPALRVGTRIPGP
jgi:flavorubredoxin